MLKILPALPFLDEGRQRQMRKTMRALGEARVQATEVSQLNQKLGKIKDLYIYYDTYCLEKTPCHECFF